MPKETLKNRVLNYLEHDTDYLDPYHVLAFQQEARKRIFLANPWRRNEEPYMYLALDGDSVVGRCYYFPTLFNANGSIARALSASSLHVAPDYRKYSLGADIILFGTFHEAYSHRIFAGISPMALPIYKKLNYLDFELQRLILRKNTKSFLQSRGLNKFIVSCLSPCLNTFLNIRYYMNNTSKRLYKKYRVSNLTIVPQWVEDIVKRDPARYMEVHNREWFQWQLTGSFANRSHDKQKFFGIYNKADQPVGFFLIKERCDRLNGQFCGGIYEWGSIDENLLSESDIYQLAIPVFDKHVYLIEVGCLSPVTIAKCKKIGFKPNGSEHILFKSDNKDLEGIDDMSNWRLRLGYADTIFS